MFREAQFGYADRTREAVNANRILGENLLGRQIGRCVYNEQIHVYNAESYCVKLVKLKINIRLILCKIGDGWK